MKITALANVEVPGYGIVRRGETIEYPKDRIDERIVANFVGPDEKRLKASSKNEDERQGQLFDKTKEEMLAEQEAAKKEARKALLEKLGGIEGVKEKLAEYKATFKKEASDDELCDRLLEIIGE